MTDTYDDRLRRSEWYVADMDFNTAQRMIREMHYAKGGSNTYVYCHGLFKHGDPTPHGVSWWLPPTRVAAESVNREKWKQVLSLTRLVVAPGIPKNAATFMLAKSVKMIKQDARFVSLVTYADESQGHLGRIYRAANWVYVGRTGPYPRWIDPSSGRQVAPKATKNRTKAQMEELGYIKQGSYYKHKYILHLTRNPISHMNASSSTEEFAK